MFMNFDLAGAEWWVTGYVAREPAMLELARQSPRPSPHPHTGARMTGVSQELIVKDDKLIGKNNDPLVIAALRREQLPDILASTILPRTMSIRQMSKKANHGLNYREGYKTFALKNEIVDTEAQKIVRLYREVSYPGLLDWYNAIDEQIRSTRTLVNCFGRKIYFMGQLSDDTFRQATSAIPQSTVVDVTNRAMPKILNDTSAAFKPTRLSAQVHDSLLLDYLKPDFLGMAACAHKIAYDYMRPVLDYGEPFYLDVECKIGWDWGKMEEVKLTEDIDELARRFKDGYQKIRHLEKAA